jgi:hypothetical protein
MSTPDDFINNLTSLDLSLHYATSKTISINEHLNFLKRTTIDWTPAEKDLLESEIEIMKKAINSLDLTLRLPTEIKLIKTSGADEFNSHYTRGNAIIFPIKNIEEGVTTDSGTLIHELFHIMTRHNPDLLNGLYAICNFNPIDRLVIPSSIQNIALTNPDAFYYDHAITVTVLLSNQEIKVIPFFYSAIKQTEITGPIDEAITFKLGLLDLATLNDEMPKLYKVADTNYKLKALVNSHYYIHPEEIMAENFRLLILKAANINPLPPIQYPAVLEKLQSFLSN